MRNVHLSEDVVPIGEFKAHAARWFSQIQDTNQPLVITQNGRPVGVILSPAEFDKAIEYQKFLESVSQGLEDAEKGRTMTLKEIKKRFGKTGG